MDPNHKPRPSLAEQASSTGVRQYVRKFPLKWEGKTVFETNATYFPLRPVVYMGGAYFTAMVAEGHPAFNIPSEICIWAVPVDGEILFDDNVVCVGVLNRPGDDVPVAFFAPVPGAPNPQQLMTASPDGLPPELVAELRKKGIML